MKRRAVMIGLIVLVLGGATAALVFYMRSSRAAKPLKRVEVALRAGKLQKAAEVAERYVADHPDDWRGYQLLGRARLRMAIYAEARKAFRKAAAAAPSEIEPVLALARTYSIPAEHILVRPAATLSNDVLSEAIGQLSDAIGILDKAKKANPKWALDLGEQIGRNYQRLNLAWQGLGERLLDGAEAAEGAGDEGLAKRRRRAYEKAMTEMKQAAGKAIEALLEVVKRDAARPDAAKALVTLCIQQKDKQSLAAARKAILALEPPPAVAAMMLALYESRAPFDRHGFSVEQACLWKLARRLDDLLAQYPRQVEIKLALAETLLTLTNKDKNDKSPTKKGRLTREGRLAEADSLCGEVMKVSPRDYRARLLRGRIMMKRNQYTKAERFLAEVKTDYPTTEALMAYARACMRIGRVEPAKEAMRTITRISPKYAYARRYMTEFLLRKHFYDQAFDDAKEYYHYHPGDPSAVRLFVMAAVRTEQPALADKALKKAEKDYPDRAGMLVVVAQGYAILGKMDKAKKLMKRAADCEPATPADLLAVASALVKVGRSASAERLLLGRIESDPDRVRYYEPYQPNYRFTLGQLYVSGNRPFEAVDMFRWAIRLDPRNDAYRVALAKVLFEIDDLEGCDSELKEVLDPDNVEAKLLRWQLRLARGEDVGSTEEMLAQVGGAERKGFQLAMIYFQRRKLEQCISICLEELKRTPNDVPLRSLLGQAYLAQGKRKQCLREWTRLLRNSPAKLSNYRRLAGLLAMDRSPEQAARALAAIPGARPDMVDLAMGWLLSRKKGGTAAAIKAYNRVLGRADVTGPVRNRARMGLARALAAQGDIDGSVRELDRLIRIANWKGAAIKTRAEILVRAKAAGADAALKQWEELAVESRDITALQHVVQLYLAMNRADKALDVCRRGRELFPESPRVLMMQVDVLTRSRRADQAIPLIEKIIQLQPMNLKARIALATRWNTANRPGKALEVLKAMESVSPEAKAGALFMRGQMLASWGLSAQAIECFKQLISRRYGRIPELQLSLGRAMAQLGRKQLTRKLLLAVPAKSKHYVAARLLLAGIAETDERKLDILDALEKAVPADEGVFVARMNVLMLSGQGDEAMKTYHAFAKGTGKDVRMPLAASFMALRYLFEKARYEAARQLALRTAEQVPARNRRWRRLAALAGLDTEPATTGQVLPSVGSADLYDALLGLIMSVRQTDGPAVARWFSRIDRIGRELASRPAAGEIPARYAVLAALAAGKPSQADRYARRAANIRAPVARELLSRPGSKADKAAEAAELLKATLAVDFGLVKTGRSWAMAVLVKRPKCQWAAALIARTRPKIATKRKVLEILQPDDCLLAQLMRASLLGAKERNERLVDIYRRAAEAEKGNMRLVNLQAIAAEGAGRLEEALELYRKVMKAGAYPMAANNAAYIVSRLYPRDALRLREALGWIEPVIKAVPQVAALRDTRGWILFLLGEKGRARADLRRVVKQLNRSPEVHYHLGMIEADAGNAELSRWHFAAAIDWARVLKAETNELSIADARAAELAGKALAEAADGDGK